MVKAVPGKAHLQELRSAQTGSPAAEDANQAAEAATRRFQQPFKRVEIESLAYSRPLTPTMRELLVRMTPLSWGMSEEQLQLYREKAPTEVTLDLKLLYGFI